MTIDEQALLLNQGDRFSLALRLAVKMSMAGVRSEEFVNTHNTKHPLAFTVYNHLRDIEGGHRKITPELIQLAQRL